MQGHNLMDLTACGLISIPDTATISLKHYKVCLVGLD